MAEARGTSVGPAKAAHVAAGSVRGTAGSAANLQDREIWQAVKPFFDARIQVMEARMESRVSTAESKAESELATALSKLDGLPKFWPLVGTIGLGIVTAVGAVFGILAFASDRFDGGLSASSIVDEVEDRQRARDTKQDELLLQILRRLPEDAEPETSPDGQD